MFSLIKYIWNYFTLYNLTQRYVNQYQKENTHNSHLLDQIISQINRCGPVAIKLTQWIIPKLELIITDAKDIKSGKKIEPILKLETLYENCDNHTDEITKQYYKQSFHTDFDKNYQLISTLGSGSIGQVYKIQDNQTKQFFVMKVIHPNVRDDIINFQKMYNLFRRILPFIPCITNYLEQLPFNLNDFIQDFHQQSDFINESNNILRFYNHFETNSFIIIPKLYQCSSDIMIMSYEEGLYIDDLINLEDNYLKYNVSILYYLFVNNNEQSYHFNHGDLHKGNWRYRIVDDKPRLVIYDFGFCFTIPEENRYVVELIIDTFEKTDEIYDDKIIGELTTITKEILIGYPDTSENTLKLKTGIEKYINQLQPWAFSPIEIIKIIINFAIQEKCKMNHLLLQFFIIAIQSTQLYEQFSFKGSETKAVPSREVYRERYLDVINFCQTNNIFKEYQELVQSKIQENQPDITDLFDTIQLPDNIKQMALS